MKRYAYILLAALLLLTQGTSAKKRQTAAQYINRYQAIAVADMERYGIPASITLAQGILESDSGNSRLSLESNNHFGIKCHTWQGGKVYFDDDEKGECFRSYPSVEDSYRDHADFLDSSPRYDSLFAYAPTNYKSWARGLKACGYATAPDYAQRLVKIIETYQLFLLDEPDGGRLYAERMRRNDPESWFADQSSVEMQASIAAVSADKRTVAETRNGYNIYRMNKVSYIQANADDTFEHIGDLFGLKAKKLRKFNDIKDKKAQPMTGETVYIERKQKKWKGNARIHICREGETAYSIGQAYGIRTHSIEKLNKLKKRDTLTEGQQIRIK